MKFYIKTFGCRTNIAESEELAEKLQKKFSPAETPAEADFVIIRACAVTARAESDVRQAIRSYKRGGKKIFTVGCFLKKISEADACFKTDAEFIKFLKKPWDSSVASLPQNDNGTGRARAFIKIQSGCDFNCAFCITKILRGKSKDEPAEKIIRQIKAAEGRGAGEIVLSGTNILLYKNIRVLINKILKETSVPRVRFGSIDPRLVTNNFIRLFHNPRLQPHLHLSLQSGSEKILEAMGRPVKIKKIKAASAGLRAINPFFNFSADIIAGYPGETEKDFEKTLKLAKELRLSKIHYFPYSPRPGTPPKSLPDKIIKERLHKIKQLDIVLQRAAKKRVSGKRLTILFEGAKNSVYYGYTPNFVRVGVKSKSDLTNSIKKFIIKKINL